MLDLLPLAASLTRLDIVLIVLAGVAALCIPVMLYLVGEDQRDQRQHRRKRETHRAAIELAEARTAYYDARRLAACAHDEGYAASVRAERDAADRRTVQLLHHNDQLEAELKKVRGELAASRDYVHRVNRSQLQSLATHLEAERTLQLPVVAHRTRELPRLPPGPRRILEGTPT